jgi:hypothetical protein
MNSLSRHQISLCSGSGITLFSLGIVVQKTGRDGSGFFSAFGVSGVISALFSRRELTRN